MPQSLSSVRNEVWGASKAKRIRYVWSEVHKYRRVGGWGGIRMGAGVYATYSNQYAFNDPGFGHTMAFSMLFTGLTAYYKNRLRAPLIQIYV